MSRRMIDPSVIIKSQIYDDVSNIEGVDLNEILEKHGEVYENFKSIVIQVYQKAVFDDGVLSISDDTGSRGFPFVNPLITITKIDDNIFVNTLLTTDGTSMDGYLIEIEAGSYTNGVNLKGSYPFDVHVIRV